MENISEIGKTAIGSQKQRILEQPAPETEISEIQIFGITRLVQGRKKEEKEKEEKKKEAKKRERKEKICAYYTAVYPQRRPLPLSDDLYNKR